MNYGDVYVQINRICDPEKYIHLSKLDEALHYAAIDVKPHPPPPPPVRGVGGAKWGN